MGRGAAAPNGKGRPAERSAAGGNRGAHTRAKDHGVIFSLLRETRQRSILVCTKFPLFFQRCYARTQRRFFPVTQIPLIFKALLLYYSLFYIFEE
jgi:hypothetical protein